MTAAKRKKSKPLPFHFKRITADLKIIHSDEQQEIMPARMILNDLTPKGVILYSQVPIPVGKSIALTTDYPRRIYLRGKVEAVNQRSTDRAKVISTQSFGYSVQVVFSFNTDAEKTEVQDLYDWLRKDYLVAA